MAVDIMRLFRTRAAPLQDSAAFSAFYELTHRNVFRYATALCGSGQEAEDVTAEAYLRAWRGRDSFQGDEHAALGWVITIARHVVVDRYRSKATRSDSLPVDEELPSDGPDVDEIMVTNEQIDEVFQQVRRLPEAQRDMMILRYVLGWRVNQVARHLGVSENVVSVSLRRAAERVRRGLETSREVSRG